MAANQNAVLRKMAKRGGRKAIERARAIVEKNPEGALARRLGAYNGAGLTRGINIEPKRPISQSGRSVNYDVPASVISDARPAYNAALRHARRMPGSPF